jgi:hypothetical protein
MTGHFIAVEERWAGMQGRSGPVFEREIPNIVSKPQQNIIIIIQDYERLCSLVVRVSG